jgi:hypothetical protein
MLQFFAGFALSWGVMGVSVVIGAARLRRLAEAPRSVYAEFTEG